MTTSMTTGLPNQEEYAGEQSFVLSAIMLEGFSRFNDISLALRKSHRWAESIVWTALLIAWYINKTITAPTTATKML